METGFPSGIAANQGTRAFSRIAKNALGGCAFPRTTGAFGAATAVAADRAASAAEGSVIALMVMAVAAAEATVGLAIVIAIYRNKKTPLVDEYDAMKQ